MKRIERLAGNTVTAVIPALPVASVLVLLCAFIPLTISGCGPPDPEGQVLAIVGGREITEDQLQFYVDTLPEAARRGVETENDLLEAFILHRLLLLEAKARNIGTSAEFLKAFRGWGERELASSYVDRKVNSQLTGPPRGERMRALTDSLWVEYLGDVNEESVRLVAQWLAAGRPPLREANLDRTMGSFDDGQQTVREFIAAVSAADAEVVRRLSNAPAVATMVRDLMVGRMVSLEAKALGLPDEPSYKAKAEVERERLLVRLLVKSAQGPEYGQLVSGLRHKYGVRIVESGA